MLWPLSASIGVWRRELSFNTSVKYSEVPELSYSNAGILSIIYPPFWERSDSASKQRGRALKQPSGDWLPPKVSSSPDRRAEAASLWAPQVPVQQICLMAEDTSSASGRPLSTLSVVAFLKTEVCPVTESISSLAFQVKVNTLGAQDMRQKWAGQDATDY